MTPHGAIRGSRICCGVSDWNDKSYLGFEAGHRQRETLLALETGCLAKPVPGLSLALIGNALGRTLRVRRKSRSDPAAEWGTTVTPILYGHADLQQITEGRLRRTSGHLARVRFTRARRPDGHGGCDDFATVSPQH